MSSDSEIIRQAAGSPATFAELYDRYARQVHRFVSRRIGSGTADDITSETFLVAFERRASYDVTVADARPWLFGIATVLLRKHRRLEARMWRGLEPADAIPADTGDTDERLDAQLASAGLHRALGRLKPADRDVFLLFAWEELNYAQIAQGLRVPVGTVRSRLNRARRQLRQALGDGTPSQKEVEHGRAGTAAFRAQ